MTEGYTIKKVIVPMDHLTFVSYGHGVMSIKAPSDFPFGSAYQ